MDHEIDITQIGGPETTIGIHADADTIELAISVFEGDEAKTIHLEISAEQAMFIGLMMFRAQEHQDELTGRQNNL